MNKPLNAQVWDRDPDDYYVEEEWCDKRLFDAETLEGVVWDPACGSGRIVRSAQAAGLDVYGSDRVIRTGGERFWEHPVDFLQAGLRMGRNIVMNPPFGDAEAIVRHALELATGKVAALLPQNWLWSDKRALWLPSTPLRRVWLLTPRPSMPPGAVIEAGINPGGGKKDFAWFVWLQGYDGPVEMNWLRRDA